MNTTISNTNKFNFRNILKNSTSTIIMFWIVLMLFFASLTNNFFGWANIEMLLRIAMVTITMSFAQMVFLSFGAKNNAIGAVACFSAVICGGAMDLYQVSTGVAILVGMVTGALCGLISGFICYRMGATGSVTFLITLAMNYTLKGVATGLTSSVPFYNLNESFVQIAASEVFGIPVLFLVAIFIACLLYILYRKTGLGRQILAIGSNPSAAVYSGVSMRNTLLLGHVISCVIASIAGMMACAKLGSTQMDIGLDWMLYSIAAPVLGGTSQKGGRVFILGTIIGAMVLATVEDGLVLLGANVYFNTFIEGMIILIAVVVDRVRNGKES